MQWGVTIASIYFNSIDIIVFGLAVIAGIVGTLRGFAQAFSHRSGFFIGFFAGLMFTKPLSLLLQNSFYLPPLASALIGWIVLFFLGHRLMVIVGRLVETALKAIGLHHLNSLLGFLWGVVEFAIASALILYILELQQAFDLSAVFDQSQFILNIVRPLIPEGLKFLTTATGAV